MNNFERRKIRAKCINTSIALERHEGEIAQLNKDVRTLYKLVIALAIVVIYILID